MVAIIGILAALSTNTYRSYTARSQVARVMSETATLKTALEQCVTSGKLTLGVAITDCDPQYTGSNLMQDAPFAGSGLPVAGVGYPDIQNLATAPGTPLRIVATFGNRASSLVLGQTLTWERDATSGSWSCATTVAQVYKPTGCS
ncbi:pilin [Viridibacterium curvum]|uniref:Pilin n=1 Tax=Viridibacterium curvum TaxID=1101404 RepID=A0ABP9QBJ8_9RHOO